MTKPENEQDMDKTELLFETIALGMSDYERAIFLKGLVFAEMVVDNINDANMCVKLANAKSTGEVKEIQKEYVNVYRNRGKRQDQ